MAEQLSLPEIAPALQARDRLFFAIFPDLPAAARIEQLTMRLRREHALTSKQLSTGRFHATLYHLGDYVGLPPAVIAQAAAAAATVSMPAFDVAFDRAASFSGRRGDRPLVLLGSEGLGALMALQHALSSALAKVGLAGRSTSHFTPHITLPYGSHQVAEHPVDIVKWTAREFVLVHSLLGQTTHVPLARWTLFARDRRGKL